MLAMVGHPIDRFVEFVVARRHELGLTQRQLAEAAGMNPGTLANIELGRVTKAPSLGTLERLAQGLRMSVSDVVLIARGLPPVSVPDIEITLPPSMLETLPGRVRETLTPDEIRALREAAEMDISMGVFFDPRMWSDPDTRRIVFWDLEQTIDRQKKLRERLKGE